MKYILLFSLLLLAEITIAQKESALNWLSIETNTTPLIFGGYALGINIRPQKLKNWSLLLGQAGNADFPDWVVDIFRPQNSGKGIDWEVKTAQVLAIDYFLNENGKGWYFGQFNFFFKNRLTKDGISQNLQTHIPMLRAGYRWFPFDVGYFYLSPWVGLGTEYRMSGSGVFAEETWETTNFHYFASLNVGFQF